MGLMNSPAMRAYGCGQWMRSHGVNELVNEALHYHFSTN